MKDFQVGKREEMRRMGEKRKGKGRLDGEMGENVEAG